MGHTRQDQGDAEGPALTLCLETRSGANRFPCDKPELDMFQLEGSFHKLSCLLLIKKGNGLISPGPSKSDADTVSAHVFAART